MLGNVYEKRLIEAYIAENHKDPVNGEELEITDLIDLKSSRIVAPRPPTLTSIPSLLSTFQNEWDALALESFNLRQQLQQTRQELATALYQHDAAVRVIARLTRERDAARDALSKVTIGAGGASNGDAMQIDSQGLPEELAEKVDATQEKYEINFQPKENKQLIIYRLSKSRRKRPVPKEWADSELIEKFGVATTSKELYPGAKSLAVDEGGQLVVFGGDDGVAGIFSIPENKVVQSFKAGGAVTDAVWYGSQPIISTASGAVKVFGDSEISFTSHAGSANGLALHPSGDILASVGVDKSFVFYDLAGGRAVTQVYTDSGTRSHDIVLGKTNNACTELTTAAFHPDGHLFAAGGIDGQIKLFHVKTGENAANFDLGGPVQDIAFSENGIWFAAVAKGSNSVVIFDLRKEGKAAEAKVLEIGGQVDSIRWDYTGQYLAASGPRGLTISQYTKTSKSWSDVISIAVPATAVAWGPEAKTLVTVNSDGVITVLG